MKLCLRTETFCVPRGNKGFENLNVNFVRKKTDSPLEHYTSFPLMKINSCYLSTGKIEKAYLVRNFFVYLNDEIPAIFFKLGAWRAAKTRACLLRFSAVKL